MQNRSLLFMKFMPARLPVWVPVLLTAVLLCAAAADALAQTSSTPSGGGSRIFRCGNAYTNDLAEAQAKGCKPLDGGNLTVVQGTRVQSPPRAAGASASASTSASTSVPSGAATGRAASSGPRVDSAAQRARDADARYILEAELKKAESRHAELLREYNNGEPEKLGPETRNHQKYLDRVAELKASIARSEADIAGIRRELSRLGTSK